MVAVVTLGLGIGANAAIFSVVNGVLLQPLPYGAPDGLISLRAEWAGTPDARLSEEKFRTYVQGTSSLWSAGAWKLDHANLAGDPGPQRVAEPTRRSWIRSSAWMTVLGP